MYDETGGTLAMPARKSPEPAPEPGKRKPPGRPKKGEKRPSNRIIIKGSPDFVEKWRAYVERHTPPHYEAPNGSLVFRELFERVLVEEKAAKKNPKSR